MVRKIFNRISVLIVEIRNLSSKTLGLVLTVEKQGSPLLFAQNVARESPMPRGIVLAVNKIYNPTFVLLAEIRGFKHIY